MALQQLLMQTAIDEYRGFPIHYLEDSSWFKILNTVSNRDEGTVYLVEIFGRTAIAKTNHDIRCLIYEYIVGLEVNKIDSINFAKTLGLFFTLNTQNLELYGEYVPYILIEYLEGQLLYDYILENPEEDILQLYRQLTCALQLAQERVQFTHYDLHAGNVIIQKFEAPTKIRYDLKRGNREFPATFIVKIIDFGYSHVNLDLNAIYGDLVICLDSERLETGTIPSVFDPLDDILYTTMFLLSYGQTKYGKDFLMPKQKPLPNSVKIYQYLQDMAQENYLSFDGSEDWDIVLDEDTLIYLEVTLNRKLQGFGETRRDITFPLKSEEGIFIVPKIVKPISPKQYKEALIHAREKDVSAIKSLEDALSPERLWNNTKIRDQLFSSVKLYQIRRRKTKDLYKFLQFLEHLMG